MSFLPSLRGDWNTVDPTLPTLAAAIGSSLPVLSRFFNAEHKKYPATIGSALAPLLGLPPVELQLAWNSCRDERALRAMAWEVAQEARVAAAAIRELLDGAKDALCLELVDLVELEKILEPLEVVIQEAADEDERAQEDGEPLVTS